MSNSNISKSSASFLPPAGGGVIINPLSEGSFTIDKTKILVPFSDTDNLKDRPAGSLLVEIQPFCIVTERDVLLIDTGLGYKNGDTLQLLDNLKANGVEPASITKVLMSHLHKDHVGGATYKDEAGNYQMTFPNAVYFVQRREFDYAQKTGYPSYNADEFQIFDSASNVCWLNEDEGTIDNYIRYRVTNAHSPFHQVFWIAENGETIFFGGDDAPQKSQMTSRFIAKYDYDGKKCMELRSEWWAKGKVEGWTFLFYHDSKEGMVKV